MKSFDKIVTLPVLIKKLASLRRRRCIAFTNGCFDILHYGHVSYLESAKKQDRILVVGLNSDVSVRTLDKGPERPIVPQDQRAAVLAGLACVDFVVIFDDPTPSALIKAVKPEVLIKGADWKGKAVAGSDTVKANGGRVEFITYIDHLSTTSIIEKIRRQCLLT